MAFGFSGKYRPENSKWALKIIISYSTQWSAVYILLVVDPRDIVNLTRRWRL